MGKRPMLVQVSAEIQRLSALLEEEASRWPQVTSRPMFGMLALYRGKKIFAALPRTRAAETESSLLIKLPGAKHPRLGKASSPGAGWTTFEMNSPEDMTEALRWLRSAYRKAK